MGLCQVLSSNLEVKHGQCPGGLQNAAVDFASFLHRALPLRAKGHEGGFDSVFYDERY